MENHQLTVLENTNAELLKASEQKTIAAFFSSFESQLTAREYMRASGEFLGLVAGDIQNLSDLSRDHLIFYQKWLREHGKSRKTILKKLSAVSSLCKHLAHEGIVDRDLSYGLKRPPATNKKETADFSDAEVKKIFASLNPRRKCFTSHRAILAVGFYTGLRSLEIRTLKIGHIVEVKGHRVLSLTIKGNKPHEVPLNPFCYHAIEEHIKTLESLGFDTSDPDQWLFPCLSPVRNQPMSRSGLQKILNTRLKDAGIPISSARRYSPHSMRATLAGHLLNTVEAPLEQVQKTLGHASPTTTQKYNKREADHGKNPVYRIEY